MTHSEEKQYHAMSGLPYQPEGMPKAEVTLKEVHMQRELSTE
jgi:hypothetical protein